MAFLLDTCLLSEVWKPKPNRGVLGWLREAYEEDLFLSVLTLGELTKGIERLPPGKKKKALERDYAALRSRFSTRIIPIHASIAETWGELSARAVAEGKHLHVVDGLLAASALVEGLSVVTRNVQDFAVTPVPVVNPWS